MCPINSTECCKILLSLLNCSPIQKCISFLVTLPFADSLCKSSTYSNEQYGTFLRHAALPTQLNIKTHNRIQQFWLIKDAVANLAHALLKDTKK